MKFTVQNLGRLVEATIDLDKDLILFVGPNNTSKTYVAHTLYGFYSHVVSLFTDVLEGKLIKERASVSFDIDLSVVLDKLLPDFITDLEQRYRSKLADVLAADDNFTIHTRISLSPGPHVIKHFKDWFRDKNTIVDFEIGQAHHARVHSSPGELVFHFDARAVGTDVRPSPSRLPPASTELDTLIYAASRYLSILLSQALFIDSGYTYILPAERAAIQLFSRELSTKRTQLIDELLILATRGRKGSNEKITEALQHGARRYPEGIRAYLELANDLTNRRKLTSSFAPLADRLDELIGGTLHVTDDGDLRFQPGPESPHLDLHLASSSVKALAGLSFHLRHLLTKGDILIVDEPELNLHPDNQRRVARVLARLARGGVKVIITTHSDYIVRELNNLIMLSADEAGELRERHGYIAEETLKPAQVGAYRFDTTHAHSLEVKPTGIEVETIDREINALNKVSQEIYFSLFDKS